MHKLAVSSIECVDCKNNVAVFVAEPLERGFATTLGNSIRRVLLSYLPGAAVTQVRIEGILHEFAPIPQAKEDVIEFLLNVKGIRLKPLSGNPGRLVIDVAKAGEVKAGDIKPSNDFQVVNPDLHLLTLADPQAKFYAELDVDLGTGYQQAVSNVNLPSGFIPVDAVFTPVREVNFNVEAVAVGKESSNERLRLEVRTDGTISPQEALGQAANILVEQLLPFTKLMSLSPGEGRLARWIQATDDSDRISVDDLKLSKRVSERLKRSGVTTVGAIMALGEAGLLALDKIGEKTLEEVRGSLAKEGLDLPPGEVGREGGRLVHEEDVPSDDSLG